MGNEVLLLQATEHCQRFLITLAFEEMLQLWRQICGVGLEGENSFGNRLERMEMACGVTISPRMIGNDFHTSLECFAQGFESGWAGRHKVKT
jgi:hypothetical protein